MRIQWEQNITARAKLALLGKCFLVIVLIDIVAASVMALANKFIFHGSFPLLADKAMFTNSYSLAVSILLVVFESPVSEEFAFRGWFSKNKILVTVSTAAFVYFLLDVVLFKVLNINTNVVYLCFGVLIPISLLLAYLFSSIIMEWIHAHYNLLIILSVMLFSSLHGFNFNPVHWDFNTIMALMIILWSYPFKALVYTYIRIKNGLAWSILLHSLANALVILPALLRGNPI